MYGVPYLHNSVEAAENLEQKKIHTLIHTFIIPF